MNKLKTDVTVSEIITLYGGFLFNPQH